MAKLQRRRSISFETRLHDLIVERAAVLGMSTSAYMSDLARKELLEAGIEPPPAKYVKPISNASGEVRETRLVDMVPPPAPDLHLPDAKYLMALEFTREKLKRGEPIGPKPRICGWCDETFKRGEAIVDYEDMIVHERCKGAIEQFNG